MLPDEILIHILSYFSYFDVDVYLGILQIDDYKRKHIKKILHSKSIKVHTDDNESSTTTSYKIENVYHNEFGPARIRVNKKEGYNLFGMVLPNNIKSLKTSGYKEWYIRGYRHRLDGPAVVYNEGAEEYWVNNKLHNDFGPALISRNVTEYYRHGKWIT